MSSFLETLKQGLQESQQKFVLSQQKLAQCQNELQAAQQRFNVANAEHQTAMQEFQAFNTLTNLEARKEQQAVAATAAGSNGASSATLVLRPGAEQPKSVPISTINESTYTSNVAASVTGGQLSSNNKAEGNKTEVVRDFLRQHSTGVTPSEIWKELESQMSGRAYLYSVLKRLKDRGDVREKRGKYYFIQRPQELTGGRTVQIQ